MRHDREDYDEEIRAPDWMIPGDEPVFLLRGQDVNAEETVRFWAHLARESGADEETVRSALAQADRMRDWPRKKVPDV
jgi:hypothetical protein